MRNMRDSYDHHNEYKIKNMEIIKGKQSFLREEIDQIVFMNTNLKQPTIDMVNMNQLKAKLEHFIKDRVNVKNYKALDVNEEENIMEVERMKRDLDQAQVSFSYINKVLLEINDFVKKTEGAEHSIKVYNIIKLNL